MRQYVWMGQVQRGVRISAAALTAAVLVAGCASASSRAGSSIRAGATRSEATLHTFQIDSTFTGQGEPTVTQRRLVDDDRSQREIFPSSEDGGSTPNEIDVGTTSYVIQTGLTCNGVQVSGVKWERVPNPPLTYAEARFTDPFDYPLTAVSPAEALTELSPLVTAIRMAGGATIDGVSTTEFVLSVSNAQMQSFMEGGQLGVPTDPTVRFAVAMWVDASNRLRQSQITVTAPDQSIETITNRYSSFGTPLNITIPPASEIVQNCS
jgi:hypothetical protein